MKIGDTVYYFNSQHPEFGIFNFVISDTRYVTRTLLNISSLFSIYTEEELWECPGTKEIGYYVYDSKNIIFYFVPEDKQSKDTYTASLNEKELKFRYLEKARLKYEADSRALEKFYKMIDSVAKDDYE